MMENWHSEIVQLHDFFADYLNGTVAADETNRMEIALRSDFTMVAPDGSVSDRSAVIGAITKNHGAVAGMEMSITNVELLYESPGVIAARYIENQVYDAGSNSRWSTVIFEPSNDAPNGFVWLALHETWLAEI